MIALLLRLLLGGAPGRALRRADRMATEALGLLRAVRTDTDELQGITDRLDGVIARLDGLEGRAGSLETRVSGVGTDVAALRADAAELQRLLPGDDDPGPLEKAKRAVTGTGTA